MGIRDAPYKPALEEKSAFALLHHPVLRPFWEKELGEATLLDLTTIMPQTWLLDPAPIPRPPRFRGCAWAIER